MGLAKWGALLALLLSMTVSPAVASEVVETDLRWLERLAEQGDPEAWYRIGVIKEQGIGTAVDLAGALEAYRAAAELGHSKAKVRLAQLLASGQVGPPDFAAARQWYGEAAADGIAEAAYNAGVYAETGVGGPVDMAAAEAYYRQAAAAGLAPASERLGLLYLEGRLGGAPDGGPDRVTALAWLLKAAEQGSTDAAALAQDLSAEMSAEDRAAAQRLKATL